MGSLKGGSLFGSKHGWRHFPHSLLPDCLWDLPTLLYNGCRWRYPWGLSDWPWIWPLNSTGAKIKNMWSYTTIPPYTVKEGCLMKNRDIFIYICFFFHFTTAPSGPKFPHCRGFKITLRHTTLGRTPLDERSAHRGNLYLTTHSSYKRQRHLYYRRDSNLQFQQASGSRPTP
jgi:hypothetical protein